MQDISKYFTKTNYAASRIAKQILEYEGTPQAIETFIENAEKLDDYSYWFLLSTCWVSYTGHSKIEQWKELFSSNRPRRKQCIMKPSEVKAYNFLPNVVIAYRAHREDETDWIAYTLDIEIAKRFAKERGVKEIKKYAVNRKDICALFAERMKLLF